MKALLYKDLVVLKSTLLLMLGLAALMAILAFSSDGSGNFLPFIMVFVTMLPFSSLSFDERAQWGRFALTTRVSRRKLALSKYVFGLLLLAIVLVFGAAITYFTQNTPEGWLILAVIPAGSLLLQAITTPIMFRFGSERARIVLMVAIIAASISAMSLLSDIPPQLQLPDTANLLWMGYGCIAVLYVLSVLISCRIYDKKEFA